MLCVNSLRIACKFFVKTSNSVGLHLFEHSKTVNRIMKSCVAMGEIIEHSWVYLIILGFSSAFMDLLEHFESYLSIHVYLKNSH